MPSNGSAAKPDPALLKAIARARAWFEELRSGQVRPASELVTRFGVRRRHVNYLLPLGFPSPEIVAAIVAGRQPVEPRRADADQAVALPPNGASQKASARNVIGISTLDSNPANRRPARDMTAHCNLMVHRHQ
jgi:site-specific DNA recombinase